MTLDYFEAHLLKEAYCCIQYMLPFPIDLKMLIAESNIKPGRFTAGYKYLFGQTPGQHKAETILRYKNMRLKKGVSNKTIANELRYKFTSDAVKMYQSKLLNNSLSIARELPLHKRTTL